MRSALLAAITLSAVLTVSAQTPPQATPAPPAQPGQPPTVFRSGVDLVRLDVRVTDENGRPVDDLRASEVEIVDAGQPRPVLLFQHVQQPRGTYAEVARRTIAAEVSTNQGAPRGAVYVLVFDQAHILAGNEQKARLAAERFLRTRVKPGDRIALHALPGPGPQIDFTADVSRAIRELVAVRGSREETVTGSLLPMRIYEAYEITRANDAVVTRYVMRLQEQYASTDAPATVNRPNSARDPEDPAVLRRLVQEDARNIVARADAEARGFLSALTSVVRTLRDVDGRKSVVLFSEGFEVDNVRHELEDVAAAAAESYSVVYALDLNSRATPLSQATPGETVIASEILSRLESLGSLVAETDGVLFNDAGSQPDEALARVSEASQDYYLVGFEPAAGHQDRNQYRHVKVQVKRPGVRVSARTGYALGARPTAAGRRRAIDGALRAPFSQQGLRVEYTTYVLRGASDLQRVILSMAAQLPVATKAAHTADVVFSARDTRTGRIAASGTDTMPLPEAGSSSGPMGVSHYRVQFELPPGRYLMRAVVREPGGLLGSADRRFQVRALAGASLTAGDLVLTSADTRGLPVRALAPVGGVLAGVVELYGRTAEQVSTATVTADLLPIGGAAAVTSGHAALDEIRSGASGSSRGARIEIPLEGIAPGEYIVRATVRSGHDTAAELLRDVTIIPAASVSPALPSPAPAGQASDPMARFDPAAVMDGEIGRQFLARLRERAGAALAPLPADAFEALAQRGVTEYLARDYARAAAAWKDCLEREPDNAPVAFLLGWAHAASGDDRAAVSAWRSAVIADSRLVPAYLALVDAYLRLGQPDLALQVARRGATALPEALELRDRVLRLERR